MGSVFSPDGNYLVIGQRGMFSVYDVQEPGTPKLLSLTTVAGRRTLCSSAISCWSPGAAPARVCGALAGLPRS